MAFLRNDAVNRVNLHSGIQALAQGAGGIFFMVFLLKAGVPIPAALVAQAAIVAGRFLLRPAILPLARRLGLKPLLIVGTLGVALQYPLLAEVQGVGTMLFVFCIVSAIGEIFYWPCYHAYFSAVGDAEHRGHQIGAREALTAVVNIVAPLLGAWALVTVGPTWTFAAAGLVQAAAALPLLGAPNIPVKPRAPGALRAAWYGAAIIAVDGWFDACLIFVWQIALFISLGESIPAYGGAMALAGVVGAVFGLILGRHIDAGHGRRAVAITGLAAIGLVLLRAASLGSPWLAIIANALGALFWPLLIPTLGAALYNMAKDSPCPLRFQIMTETGWDVGACFGCLIAAALYAWGAPLAVGILLALPGTAAMVLLLWRYYPARVRAVEAEPERDPQPS
jgi:MFS transporter, DHA1 family, inner membrane transport protein